MTPIDQFRANISRARHLGNLYVTITSLKLPAIDLTDILRAELVMAVSALDHLMHELTRVGMLGVYSGSRPATEAYLRFRVPMGAVALGLSAPDSTDWLDTAIREAHGWLSFEQPDKIADATRLFSTVTLWEAVGGRLGLDAKDVRTRVKAIVDRRNKIAHEADLDPTLSGSTWPIDEQLATTAVNFIEQAGLAIAAVI